MDLASYLSATAAAVAAALAAVNLYVTGRRARNQWLRDSLVEVYVAFLHGSFEITSRSRRIWSAGSDGRADAVAELKELRRTQLDTMTRLRLLAPKAVVEAASALLTADQAIADMGSTVAAAAVDDEQLQAARNRSHALREDLIRAARRSMNLRGPVAEVRSVGAPR